MEAEAAKAKVGVRTAEVMTKGVWKGLKAKEGREGAKEVDAVREGAKEEQICKQLENSYAE